MKYGGDKIKVVTDDLNKGDNLQALGFDTCGYLLIGKWNNEYGTQGDPLMAEPDPCYDAGSCPNCQEKITDIANLPGRPAPCSNGDAFIMMDRNGALKTLCKSNFNDSDELVKTSSGDGVAGYLVNKIKACSSSSPIKVEERSSGDNNYLCISWNPENAGLNFTDLMDTPDNHSKNGLVYSTGNSLTYFKPTPCESNDFSYLIYRNPTDGDEGGYDTMCPIDTSLVDMYLKNDYEMEFDISTTQSKPVKWSGNNIHMEATPDIRKGTGDNLFYLTRPGVYVVTLNLTFMNETEAWLKAARAGITLNGQEVGDAKYDSRYTSPYINEEYPSNFIDHQKSGREIDLRIMSFNTTYIITLRKEDVSASNPASIGIAVKVDTQIADPRHTATRPTGDVIKCKLTSGIANEGAKTRLSAARIGDIPKHYTTIVE